MTRRCHIDFETRSAVELKTAGLHVYADHESTLVLCMAWAFDDYTPQLWMAGAPFPSAVIDHVRASGEVVAHNAAFEIAMWNGPLRRQLAVDLPALTAEQCDCTMARAYALSLPGALDDLAVALKTGYRKDPRGRVLIQKLSKPQRAKDGSFYWNNDAALLAEFGRYCQQDVRVEQLVDKLLMPLSASERALWVLDQKINGRGVAVDLASVRNALVVADAEADRTTLEIRELTGGDVGSASQVQALKTWLAANGVKTKKLTKAQVTAAIRDNPNAAPAVRKVLTLRQEGSKASIQKLKAMQKGVSADGRVRGLFQYHGAGTGRWSGRRVQLQNMPRSPEEFTPQIAEAVIDSFAHPRAAEFIRLAFGKPSEQLSYGVRSMLVADTGNEFHACDFSNIEGRVLAWLASETWKLQAFRDYDAGTGHDLYKLAYASSFGLAPDDVTKDQRQLGKVQELALGFGGGVGAFASMAANYGIWVGENIEDAPADAKQKITHDQADELKRAWREAHPAVVALWYDLDRAARKAITRRGETVHVAGGKLAYKMHDHYLLCRLPSGRVIAYPFARIEPAHDFETRKQLSAAQSRVKELVAEKRSDDDATLVKWRRTVETLEAREKTDTQITYDGFNSITHKWGAETTYSGKLFENVVQATARDVLSESMSRLEAAGYPVVLHVHDENVCEMPIGQGDIKTMARIMSVPPAWAPSLPVAVDGWTGRRYRK